MSVAIGITHDAQVEARWVMCLLGLRQHPDIETVIMVEGGVANFDVARNKVVRHFLTQTTADHLLTLDTDMVFRPSDYEAIRDRNLPVVSGLYYINDRPPRPCMARYNDEGRLKTVTDWDEELVRVDACGSGFLLIHRDVLLAIGDPSDTERMGPWYRGDIRGPAGQVLEVDHGFHRRIREAGYDIVVDTSVTIGHIKPFVLGYEMP